MYVSGFRATCCHGATSLSGKAWRPSTGFKIWLVCSRNLPVMIKISVSQRQFWQLFPSLRHKNVLEMFWLYVTP